MRSSRSQWLAVLAVMGLAAFGVAGGAVMAALGDIPSGDAARLLGYSTAGAGLAGVTAFVVLRAWRRASIRTQAVVAVLAPVLAVGLGVAWAAQQMFLMAHDLWVLWVVLFGAGSVGLITAMVLGWRVAAATRSVGDMARQLGDGSMLTEGTAAGDSAGPSGPSGPSGPRELVDLAAELRQTSARLAEAREQAAALEASRRELVAWVSHDLRTPLAGIRAMVEALEDGVVDDPDTVARYHRTMRREADRLAALVDDLFELSRIHAGSLSLRFESIPLDRLVSDAIAGASVAAAAKDITLRDHVAHPAPVVELSTPDMARVVRNLLDNAIRHTPRGGVVTVTAGVDDSAGAGETESVEVSVQDGCGGIPEHDLDLVFDLAYRGDAARTPGDGGGGLGLAVARGLVEAHHGDISVRNVDPGCRFTVRLPRLHP
jgi:signal transduction histidine kinase